MVNRSKWGAKLAMVYSIAAIGVVLIVYRIFGFGIFQSTSWHIQLNLPFPADFVVGPIVEVILLTLTLLLARYKRASLKELGLERSSLKILARNLVALIPLFLATVVVTGVLTIFSVLTLWQKPTLRRQCQEMFSN